MNTAYERQVIAQMERSLAGETHPSEKASENARHLVWVVVVTICVGIDAALVWVLLGLVR